jgi:acetoin:2,6-dichlorophenolindophenol oxidoreductase subunit alpha
MHAYLLIWDNERATLNTDRKCDSMTNNGHAVETAQEQITRDVARDLYAKMVKIRRFEEKIVEIYPKQEMKCPVHLSIGQEGNAAGVCQVLRDTDLLFATHRSHGPSLAKGIDMRSAMAELYLRKDGCAGGKGGSQHMVDLERGIPGSTAIVAGGLPMAVGSALAHKMKKEDSVSVTFFGDGAFDQGTVYECLNFASLKQLPVIFICENNYYATHSHQRERQRNDNIYERAQMFDIPSARVDGTDVVAVYQAAQQAVTRARSGGGPTLLECIAYRWKEHVGPNFDYSLGYRSQEELNEWMNKCPIQKYRQSLLDQKIFEESELDALEAEILAAVEDAHDYGLASPHPDEETLFTDVY